MRVLLVLIGFWTLSITSVMGQRSISSNLEYINQQFELYNEYNTVWSVDEARNLLIWKNDFGVHSANFSDVEVRAENDKGWIGVYCLVSGSECISFEGYTLGDDTYSEYTMGLKDNDEIIRHIDAVLDAFAELKESVLRAGGSSGASGDIVEQNIAYINSEFGKYNPYNTRFWVDRSEMRLYWQNDFATHWGDLADVEMRANSTNSNVGVWCINSSDECLTEDDDGVITNMKSYTMTYKDGDDFPSSGYTIETKFDEIKDFLLKGGSSTTNPHLKKHLDYVNEQFATYNKYNTVWSVDVSSKQIIWNNEFGRHSADFEDVEVRADQSSGWLGVYCLNGGECISFEGITLSDRTYSEYTMGLSDASGNLIRHIDNVTDAFAEIKRIVLSGNASSANIDPKVKDKVEKLVEELNDIFEDHSSYQNEWSMDWSSLSIKGTTENCYVLAPLVDIQSIDYYERSAGDYRWGFRFIADSDIILEKCTSFERKVDKSYEFLDSSRRAEQVIDIFNEIRDLVKSM